MDAINKTLGSYYTQNTNTLTHLGADKSINELSEEEKRQVEQLKKRDAEVRAHEEAHKRAAGSLAKGSPNYKYTIGPDGKRYAVSGNVKIETSEGATADETILKAERIKRASLAPVHPSPQDRKIAAQAEKMLQEAKKEKSEENKKYMQKDITPDNNKSISAKNEKDLIKNYNVSDSEHIVDTEV